jgi:CBS domain-containing protein/sporulation protein YlmC with PRC-barrel domain
MDLVSFTALQKRPVVDAAGEPVGRLQDLAIQLVGAQPPVTKLVVTTPERQELVLPWDVVADFTGGPRDPVRLREPAARLPASRLRPDEVRLAASLLDKRVVDTARKRVVRVNDIELTVAEGRLLLQGVEGGLRGLLRHLRSEGFVERLARSAGVPLPRESVPWEAVEPVGTELARARLGAAYLKLAQLHPADIADILEELNPTERAAILSALDEETAAEAITEAEPEVQASAIQMMEPEKAADILEQMEPDEAADILDDVPEAKAQELLETMEEAEAEDVAELLEHEEDTAGGLMTTGYVSFPPSLTVSEAVARIRTEARDAETIYYLYVTDPGDLLRGVLSLRELIVADPGQTLADVMTTDVIQAEPEADFRRVAELFMKYNLLALPVVTAEGELKGIITADDVIQRLVPMLWRQRAAKKYL